MIILEVYSLLPKRDHGHKDCCGQRTPKVRACIYVDYFRHHGLDRHGPIHAQYGSVSSRAKLCVVISVGRISRLNNG